MFEQQSMDETIITISIFEQNSGLKLNYEESSVYRIGSLRNSNAKYYTSKALTWTNEPIKVVGIQICDNSEEALTLNYSEMLGKVQNILNLWCYRNLSLAGKVMIINTPIGSLFVYKMNVLPSISDKTVEQFEKIINSYLWNQKRACILLEVLNLPKDKGGLKLVSLRAKENSLKINWVFTYLQFEEIRILAHQGLNNNIGELLWQCNLHKEDIKQMFANSFWKEVLLAWSKLIYSNPNNIHQIKSQTIWYNPLLRIDNRLICNSKAINLGLTKFGQLLDKDRSIKSFMRVNYEFPGNLMFIDYYGLVKSIRVYWKRILNSSSTAGSESSISLCNLSVSKTPVSDVYLELVSRKGMVIQQADVWKVVFNLNINCNEYLKFYTNRYSITNSAKLCSFQYNILNGTLVLNEYVFKDRRRNTNPCSFCDIHVETATHFFYDCIIGMKFLEC